MKYSYLFQHISSFLEGLQPGHEHQHRLWLTATDTATSVHTDIENNFSYSSQQRHLRYITCMTSSLTMYF